ncbi:MAG: hypothetical protein M1839_004062 [Geoglossum umbratile]|nr:MAG: hypothetical protein M1839_004062 [Geoglossum umbratile]
MLRLAKLCPRECAVVDEEGAQSELAGRALSRDVDMAGDKTKNEWNRSCEASGSDETLQSKYMQTDVKADRSETPLDDPTGIYQVELSVRVESSAGASIDD